MRAAKGRWMHLTNFVVLTALAASVVLGFVSHAAWADEEDVQIEEASIQPETLEAQAGEPLEDEDEYTRTWKGVADEFERAAQTGQQVVINIGSQFSRKEGDPDLVLTGGDVVLNLGGFALDPRVNGASVGLGRVITVTGGRLTIEGRDSWTNGGITGGNAQLGGGILVEGGELCLRSGRIGGNSAEQGGGIAVVGGSCVIAGGLIERNTATHGGGVYVMPEAMLSQSGGVITNNVADYGGGICLEGADDTETSLSGGEVRNNTAHVDGGGLLVSGRVVRLGTAMLLQGNTAQKRGGNVAVGSAWSQHKSIVGVDGCTIREGSAEHGGGIALVEGGVTMFSGSVAQNEASQGAGVVVLDGECRILGGTVSGNAASFKGGGVAVVGGLLSLWGGSIEANRAEPVDDEWGETTTAEGGGILVGVDGRLELRQRPAIQNNVRGDVSQDVFLEGDCVIEVGRDYVAQGAVGVDVAELPELGEPRAIASVGPYAEGVFVCQAPDCEMVYEEQGGGQGQALLSRVRVHEGTRVSSWADLSQRLRALASGEEVSFWLGEDIIFGKGSPETYAMRPLEVRRNANVTIDLNGYSINRGLSQQETPTDEDSERCLYVSNGSLRILDGRGGGRICGGCCQRGGGVFVAEGSLVLEGGSITSNKATYGGGVYVGMGTFELVGGRVHNNVGLAQGMPCGGGVYVGDNNALVRGEGGSVGSEVTRARMTMTGGSIGNNTAAGWGAGVCVSNGSLAFAGGVVENNANVDGSATGGGGIYACGGSSIQIQGGSVHGNELYGMEGAGVTVEESSELVIERGTITRNRGHLSGGGVAIRDSEAELRGGTIDDNFSYASGGGILVQAGGTCRVRAGVVSNNRCRVDGAGVQVDFGGTCLVSGGEITGNVAWSGNNAQSEAKGDGNVVGVQSQADEGVLQEHFSSGGAINACGDLAVTGGTIAHNGAIIGCGVCFNCENWDAEKHGITLSGTPLFQDNYLSWATYDQTDVTIFMGDNEDESALIAVQGSFVPPEPVRIEKLHRNNWNSIALVNEGDYDIDAFMSAQGVTREALSPYVLVKRDGILYAELTQQVGITSPGTSADSVASQTPSSSSSTTSTGAGTSTSSTNAAATTQSPSLARSSGQILTQRLPNTGDTTLPICGMCLCAGVLVLAVRSGHQ